MYTTYIITSQISIFPTKDHFWLTIYYAGEMDQFDFLDLLFMGNKEYYFVILLIAEEFQFCMSNYPHLPCILIFNKTFQDSKYCKTTHMKFSGVLTQVIEQKFVQSNNAIAHQKSVVFYKKFRK